MRKIVQYGSPILEQKSEKVKNPLDPSILKLVDEMLEVLETVQDHSAGLSAPQIGEALQVAICRRVDLEEERELNKEFSNREKSEPIWEVMINPEIIKKSSDLSERWEGCLSVNEGDLFAEVQRPKTITVEYTNLEGMKETLEASEYFSHVVQHELDHLNGILFLKYIKDPEELYTAEELEALEKEKRM